MTELLFLVLFFAPPQWEQLRNVHQGASVPQKEGEEKEKREIAAIPYAAFQEKIREEVGAGKAKSFRGFGVLILNEETMGNRNLLKGWVAPGN